MNLRSVMLNEINKVAGYYVIPFTKISRKYKAVCQGRMFVRSCLERQKEGVREGWEREITKGFEEMFGAAESAQ